MRIAAAAVMMTAFSSAAAQEGPVAPTPAMPPSPLEQARDEAVLRQEIAEAAKAEVDARAGLIPSPPTAGTVTANPGAADPEALALAALQLRSAAADVVSDETIRSVEDTLNRLSDERQRLEPGRAVCVAMKAEIDGAKEAADKAALRNRYASPLNLCAQVELAANTYDAFVQSYGAGGGSKLHTGMQQMDIQRRLGSHRLLLVSLVAPQAASYTQSNVFSTLGAMPFHVTTASVLAWRLVDGQGEVVDARWACLYSGYQQITEVDRAVNGPDRMSERRHRRRLGQSRPEDEGMAQRPAWVTTRREMLGAGRE